MYGNWVGSVRARDRRGRFVGGGNRTRGVRAGNLYAAVHGFFGADIILL